MPEANTSGFRFTCTRCSNCCRHESGYVFLSEKDISRLCEGLSLDRTEFLDAYCKNVDLGLVRRVSLKEQENFDCVFFLEGRCSVYPFRPLQCRSYPFWPSIVESEKAWQDEAAHCPGINVGRRHSDETVLDWLLARRQEPLVED